MNRSDLRHILILLLLAVAVQGAAVLGIARLRGSGTSYAFQSRDAGEYVALARGMARLGRYVPVDENGTITGPADTWRVPGYPAFLAWAVWVAGDSPSVLLLWQQVMALAAVPLLYGLVRSFTSSRGALIAAIAWIADPFRLYYSQWLLAETFFGVVMLAGLWTWARGVRHGWSIRRAGVLGGWAGLALMVRPIGIVLPPLAWLAVLGGARRESLGRIALLVMVSIASSGLIVGPWLARNHGITGRWALSHQSGASFAYHKVVDVLLWADGRHDRRFDAAVLDEVRTGIDRQLHEKWEESYGPLSAEQRQALRWEHLNFGEAPGVDPFAASSLLWSVGLELLAEHKVATVSCFAAQGLSMLVFPLGLVLDPPAGAEAAPLSLLGSGSGTGRMVAGVIGAGYALLVLAAAARIAGAMRERRWPGHLWTLLPAAGLFVLTLPFEDPRFRLPLVPILWLVAVVGCRTDETCSEAQGRLK